MGLVAQKKPLCAECAILSKKRRVKQRSISIAAICKLRCGNIANSTCFRT